MLARQMLAVDYRWLPTKNCTGGQSDDALLARSKLCSVAH